MSTYQFINYEAVLDKQIVNMRDIDSEFDNVIMTWRSMVILGVGILSDHVKV